VLTNKKSGVLSNDKLDVPVNEKSGVLLNEKLDVLANEKSGVLLNESAIASNQNAML
jgi:hypothetical protein